MRARTEPAARADTTRAVLVTIGVTLLIVIIVAVFAAIGYRSRRHAVAGAGRGLASGGGAVVATPPLPAAARVALDSGNAAYRAKAYPRALAEYRVAAAAAPDEAAPYFGIYMAAMALHNSALADSASVAIRTRSGGQTLSDSSLRQMHSGTGLAPAHPPIRPQT